MPFNAAKHQEQQPISLPYPSNGMNISAAAQFLPEGQAVLIENLYYDYASGYLRTRYPFRKYSENILNGAPVTGIIKWNSKIYFTSGGMLYYLDGSKNANYVGTLGTTLPCLQPFHGYLQVASGTGLQRCTSANALSTVTGTGMPTTLTQIIEINQSLFGIGNTTYPDYLQKSAVRDETVWSGGTSATYGLTYEEEPSMSVSNLTVVGIAKAQSGLILVFLRGGGRKATGYLDPNETSPVWRVVSTNEAAYTWRAQCNAAGLHWIMDEFSLMAIDGVDTDEKLKINQKSLEIGSRIASNWTLDSYAHCFAFPPHAQIWFRPNVVTSDDIWVLHYLTGAITRFKTAGGLRFYSHFYDSSNSTLYLGNGDGHLYTYDITSDEYQDNPGGTDTDYPQTIKSAIYDPFPRNLAILKKPSVNYRCLTDGTGTLNFYKDYGSTLIQNDFAEVDFTFTSTYPSMSDYEEEAIADHADEYLWVSDMQTTKIPYKSPSVNTVQMELVINTGAIELKDINVDLAMGRKKQ